MSLSDRIMAEAGKGRRDSVSSDEDVDRFNLMEAFDWLERHNVDPGNLQNLAELIRLIKSYIGKSKSEEDIKSAGDSTTFSVTSNGVSL